MNDNNKTTKTTKTVWETLTPAQKRRWESLDRADAARTAKKNWN
jgi:hypothetical protein